MSKKITKEEFLSRFYHNYPQAKINLINYTAISKSAEIECQYCGQYFVKSRARDFLNTYKCCGSDQSKTKLDKLKKWYSETDEFDFVKQINKDCFIVRHNKCGQEFKRFFASAIDNPFSCKYCGTHRTSQMLSIDEVQAVIDEQFSGTIKILEYTGQLSKCRYRCKKCGLIFTQQQTSLMQSRGCPKCDHNHSKGEQKMEKILLAAGLNFKEQVKVPELPLQRFDFGIYENDKLQYFIEIQGEQHYEEREIFKEGLKKIQARDEKKRKYCKERDIPLYEIEYRRGKLKNLDILPFSSTTISVKESTPEANAGGNDSYF